MTGNIPNGAYDPSYDAGNSGTDGAFGRVQDADRRRELVKRFVAACGAAGLATTVTDPAGAIRVNTLGGNERMAEMVRLRPDGRGRLRWWWSWDVAIADAEEITDAAESVRRVVAQVVF
jgi:hypothetical protein